MPKLRRFLALLAIAIGAAAAPASADVYPCDLPNSSNGRLYLVLGYMQTAALDGSLEQELMLGRLRAQIEQDVDAVLASRALDFLDGRVEVNRCPADQPLATDNVDDYDVGTLENRAGRGSIVELWGIADATDGLVTYALPPLMLQAAAPAMPEGNAVQLGVRPYDFFQVIYAVDGTLSVRDQLLALFAEPIELEAFTALSIGAHELRQAQFDWTAWLRGYRALCAAHDLLEAAAATDRDFADWDELREWTSQLVAFAAAALGPQVPAAADCAPPPAPTEPRNSIQ